MLVSGSVWKNPFIFFLALEENLYGPPHADVPRNSRRGISLLGCPRKSESMVSK